MKALQLEQPHRWRIIDVPEPRRPGPGEALMRVHRVGVCGTDIGGYLGKFPYFSYPRIPGHELGVEVISVGDGVDNVRAGDLCSVEPYLNCQSCYACQRGFTNCCEHNQTLGVMCDGGLTERIIWPARKLHPAGSLTTEQAALVETLAIGCHAVDRAAVNSGDTVLIVGAGPIGLSCLEFARLAKAKLLVADVNPSRLQFVRDQLGIRETMLFRQDDSDAVAVEEMTDGRRADVVIDATGHSRSMVRSLEFAAFAGRVVFVGITQQNLDLPHAPILHRRELTLFASRNARSEDFVRIIRLIKEGELDTRPWITHRASFAEVPRQFPRWIEPESRVVKAMISMDD